MLEWKDVVPVVGAALSSDAAGSLALLEFLTVLPEEVTEGRKVSLTVSELWESIRQCGADGWIGRRIGYSDKGAAGPECGTSVKSACAICSIYT